MLPKSKEPVSAVIILTLLAMAVDSAVLITAIHYNQVLIALMAHLCLGAVLAGWTYYCFSKKKDCRFSVLLLIMAVAAGPFGSAICFFAVLCYIYCSLRAVSPDEWMNNIFSHADEENRLYEQVAFDLDNIAKPSGVEPFLNILSNGTMLQKQAAIAKMTRYFRPEFSPLMLNATQDDNAAVRVQAAASLSKIERQFSLRYVHLEKELKKQATDKDRWLDLAKIYEDYASAGLVDEYSIYSFREKAAQIYQEYLLDNKDPEVQARLARIYLSQNRPEAANQLISESINRGDKVSPAGLLCYIESFFNLHKFNDVRHMIKHYISELALLDKHKYLIDIEETLQLWEKKKDSDLKNDYSGERIYAA